MMQAIVGRITLSATFASVAGASQGPAYGMAVIDSDNAPAVQLYRTFGFESAYDYATWTG